MKSIQIKNVPDEVHRVYRMRAAAAGQSLQEYLLQYLIEESDHPTLDEFLDALDARSGGSVTPEFAVEVLQADRER